MQLTNVLYRRSAVYFATFFALIIWGFWSTYYSNPLEIGARTNAAILQFHGIVMTAWCVMLVAQACLIRFNKRAMHRLVGTGSYVVAPVVVMSQMRIVRLMGVMSAGEPSAAERRDRKGGKGACAGARERSRDTDVGSEAGSPSRSAGGFDTMAVTRHGCQRRRAVQNTYPRVFEYLWWLETEHMGLTGDRQRESGHATVAADSVCGCRPALRRSSLHRFGSYAG
jgi:hypothetical protein